LIQGATGGIFKNFKKKNTETWKIRNLMAIEKNGNWKAEIREYLKTGN